MQLMMLFWMFATQGHSQACPQDLTLTGALTFANTESALARGDIASTFQLYRMRNLWIRLETETELDTVEVESLVFISPNGSRFYETSRLYSRDADLTIVDGPNMHHPRDSYPAIELESGNVALDLFIPIRGTVFQRYPQLGEWTVEATIQGRRGTVVGHFDLVR